MCFSGVFFGLCSFLFIEILKYFMNLLSKRINIWSPYKGILGGVVLVLLTFLLSPQYLGLGLDTINNALEGRGVFPALAFFYKMVFTAITLNFGGSGGIVTPIFFVGSTSGDFFARLSSGLIQNMFSAIGMVSLLAGAANTPISASLMAVELFGPQVAPYAAIACVISFLMTGHRSVYPSQVLAVTKSSSISGATGSEVRDIAEVDFHMRKRSITGGIVRGYDKAKKGLKKAYSRRDADRQNDENERD